MSIKWQLFRLASAFNLDTPTLRLRDAILGNQFEDLVGQRIRSYTMESEQKGNALVSLVQGQSGINAYRYAILAHAFRSRGYRPLIPLCDADLDICHRMTPEQDGRHVCAVCTHEGQKLTNAFNLDTVSFEDVSRRYRSHSPSETDLTGGEDVSRIRYRDIPIGNYALASTRSFLKKYRIDTRSDSERSLLKRFVAAAKTLVDLNEAIHQTWDIDVVVSHDDRYVHGGINLAVAAKHDIPAYSHGLGFRPQTILFGRESNPLSLPHFTDRELVEQFLDSTLSSEAEEWVHSFMEQRASGQSTRLDYSSRSDLSVESDPEDTTVGMFTNLIWDASLEVQATVFDDVLNWIDTTIETVLQNEDINLIIKTHPAEELFGTNESVSEYILDEHSPLPEQIDLLYPDTKIDTYALISDLDAGIVYNSTTGLEMCYERVPVVVGGKTHYNGFGFTFDPPDKEQYKSFLSDVDSLQFTESMHRRTLEYIYLYFNLQHIDFPFYETADDGSIEYLPIKHDDIAPGSHVFDHLVESMLNGEPLLQPSAEQLAGGIH